MPGTVKSPDGVGIDVSDPARLRSVVVVGHAGSGKTTLVEGLLTAAGALPRAGRVSEGTTVCDTEDIERRQGRSVALAAASARWHDLKITFVDTPGHADFVGEVRAGLRAADAALFVVSAVDGLDNVTRMLWEECAAVQMPRAVVVTRIDHPRGDFDEAVAICRRVFGPGVQPLSVPLLGDDDQPGGLLDLLTLTVREGVGPDAVERAADPQHVEAVEEQHVELIEAVIQESEDDTLLDRWLAGDEIDDATLVRDLEQAVARAGFFPVLPACPPLGLGIAEILDLIARGFPSPVEHPLPLVTRLDGSPGEPLTADPDGPLVAEVVKTTSDPYVGRVSLVRVFSGRLVPDRAVHVAGHFSGAGGHADRDLDERVGGLSTVLGTRLTPVASAVAGDLVAVARLAHAETGDTLSDPAHPLLMEPWSMPEPLLPTAIDALTSADDDKLSQAVARLVAEDPAARVITDPETHQRVLWSMGEAHLEVLLDRLRTRHGVSVRTSEVRVALRETPSGTAPGHGRHVKQSGGHGQFAVCELIVEPLPAGGGFEFVDEVVGGAVPRQFIASVEKGVRAQMEHGAVAGYPVVDVRVRLVGGKAHAVDSSDAAFQTAGALGLKDALSTAGVTFLEPVDAVTVTVDDEYVGTVMSDLSTRRGRVVGTEAHDTGRTRIDAEVPALELARYAVDLRSLAHGSATLTRRYASHAPLPPHLNPA